MIESDQLMASAGIVCAVTAALAWIAERRRAGRVVLDQVGFMPWTGIFFFALMGAVILGGLSLRTWVSG